MANQKTTLVSMRGVTEMTSASRTFINKLRVKNEFPQAVRLGDKRIAFIRSEVEAWISERIAQSRS